MVSTLRTLLKRADGAPARALRGATEDPGPPRPRHPAAEKATTVWARESHPQLSSQVAIRLLRCFFPPTTVRVLLSFYHGWFPHQLSRSLPDEIVRLPNYEFSLCLLDHRGRRCVDLDEISPFGHSEVLPVDFKKSRSATCKDKPTPEGQERRAWKLRDSAQSQRQNQMPPVSSSWRVPLKSLL